MEHDREDVLEVGRPRPPLWLRLGAALVVLAALALFAVRLWPGSEPHSPNAAPPDASSAPTCGWVVDLALVSSIPREERTGIRLLLGGDRLRVVDFDSGDALALPDAGDDLGDYVEVAANGSPYARAWFHRGDTCGLLAWSRVLRVGADRQVRVVESLGKDEWLLADGDRAWVVSNPTGLDHPNGSVRPLGSSDRVGLPAGFYPEAVAGDTLAGRLQSDSLNGGLLKEGLLVDATTGRIRTNLGRTAHVVAAGRGEVIWFTGCHASRVRPCSMHRRWLDTGSTTSYRLPRPTNGLPGVLSADGQLLAFGLVRSTTDLRYEGHSRLPSDLAVLHLETGRLEIVPGIEVPAKTFPGLAFSADGRWLAIVLNERTWRHRDHVGHHEIRLLAWRSGLPQPYETARIPGQVRGVPTLTMLSPMKR